MNTCSHETSRWKLVDVYDYDTDSYIKESQFITESTYIDLSTHRYTCTQCSEIFYYSNYGGK